MFKFTTSNFSEIKKIGRLDSSYFVLNDFLNTLFDKYQYKTFGDVSNFIRKGIFDLKAEKYQSYGVPFLRISNLKYFDIGKTDLVHIPEIDHQLNKKTSLKYGDFAFSKIGTLGKFVRIPKNYNEVNISQNIIGVSLKNTENKNYIFSFLLSKLFLLQIKKNKKGQLQDKLNLPDIRDIKILNIDKEIEKNINSKIFQIDEIIEKFDLLINEAQNLFYKGLNIDFSKIEKEKVFSSNFSYLKNNDLLIPKFAYPLYKRTLEKIKKEWESVTLGEISNIKKGDEVGSENYIEFINKKESDIPFIRTSDLVNYEIDQYTDYFIDETIYDDLGQDNQEGDILYTKDGKVGMIAYITQNDKCIVSSGIVKIRLKKYDFKNKRISPEYLFIALKTKEIGEYQSEMMTVTASTIPHLREERLKNFVIPLIQQEEINKITNIVKEAFKLKDQKKVIISEIQKIIDDYFKI